MKTLITAVTVQMSEGSKNATIFTDYKKGRQEYDGQIVCPKHNAEEIALDIIETQTLSHMSIVDSFKVETFKKNGSKTVEIINK